jgi:acetyl-CoA carboxylase carboxyl transferase subunit alpha
MASPKTTLSITDFEKSLADLDKNIEALAAAGQYDEQVDELRQTRQRLVLEIFAHLSPWDEVELARRPDRPYSLDYIKILFEEYTELHGDRLIGDDQAIIGGLARFEGRSVMVVAQQKGRDLKERQLRNFGYAKPQGYRKALRLMKLAEKVGIPVITFIDTPGADSNVGSEENNISEAIARNLMEMSVLETPIVSIIIGEGGSGGAIGLAVADRILMLEHSIYSVIAPEGCAAILDTFGRDPNRRAEAAASLKLTSRGALDFGLIDEVLPEPIGAAHRDPETTAQTVKDALSRHINALIDLPVDEVLARRYNKFRSMGVFEYAAADPVLA